MHLDQEMSWCEPRSAQAPLAGAGGDSGRVARWHYCSGQVASVRTPTRGFHRSLRVAPDQRDTRHRPFSPSPNTVSAQKNHRESAVHPRAPSRMKLHVVLDQRGTRFTDRCPCRRRKVPHTRCLRGGTRQQEQAGLGWHWRWRDVFQIRWRRCNEGHCGGQTGCGRTQVPACCTPASHAQATLRRPTARVSTMAFATSSSSSEMNCCTAVMRKTVLNSLSS